MDRWRKKRYENFDFFTMKLTCEKEKFIFFQIKISNDKIRNSCKIKFRKF